MAAPSMLVRLWRIVSWFWRKAEPESQSEWHQETAWAFTRSKRVFFPQLFMFLCVFISWEVPSSVYRISAVLFPGENIVVFCWLDKLTEATRSLPSLIPMTILAALAVSTRVGIWTRFRQFSAQAFFSTGFAGATILLCVLVLLGQLGLPSSRSYYTAAMRERVARSDLKAIHDSEKVYFAGHNRYAESSQLAENAPSTSHSMFNQWYVLNLTANEKGFSCTAVPAVPWKTGRYNFFVDESGIIRYSDIGIIPDAMSKPFEE